MIADPARIAIAGDWHGNTDWALRMLDMCHDREVSVVVHLGDFGLWPTRAGREYLDRVENALTQHNQILYWVDGNHEDHDALDAWPLEEDGLHRIRDHIYHLPRGHRWTWNGRTWMALGGAHSVDRAFRTPHVDWWEREHLSAEEVEVATTGGPVDVMVCHDAPFGIPALEEHLSSGDGWSSAELDASDEHRRLVRSVVDAVRPEALFHGHYHWRYDHWLTLSDGHPIRVHGLDCDGSRAEANVMFLDLTTDSAHLGEL